MKKLILIGALFLGACATTSESTHTDRAAGQMFGAVQVTGELESHHIHNNINGGNKVSRNVTIKFDGETVINGYLTKPPADGELVGKWKDKKINAVCTSSKEAQSIRVDCMVLVDNVRSVTLTF